MTKPPSRSGIFLPSRPASALRSASSFSRVLSPTRPSSGRPASSGNQHGTLDVFVVDASLRSRVEAEEIELDLEGEDVVAAKWGLAEIEEAVAEPIARLDKFLPRVVADDRVDQ